MLCRPGPSEKRRRLRRVICIVSALAAIVSAYLEFAVKTQLYDVICAQMKTLAQRSINAAVSDYLSGSPDIGKSLTALNYGDDGGVTAITSDPAAINLMKAQIEALSQDYIEARAADEGITVPLGSFSGLVLLTNLGPDIRLEIDSRCTATCSLKSAFEAAGVNQTLHHVILTVEVEIAVYNPFRFSRAIHASADFEIAQTVIVGEVPSYTAYPTY